MVIHITTMHLMQQSCHKKRAVIDVVNDVVSLIADQSCACILVSLAAHLGPKKYPTKPKTQLTKGNLEDKPHS